jgi:hypothetical protein
MVETLIWNNFTSWPGLSRPSTSLLRDNLEEIIPIRILRDNQSDLPRPRPMFDIVLALDGISDIVESLKVNESLQSVPFRKALDKSGSMFEHAPDEIVCHANIQNAIRTTGQNVNVTTACHVEDIARRGWPGQARP